MPYSGNPATSPADMLRFIIGDTDTADPQLSDAEVTVLLAAASNNPEQAAIAACDRLIAKYARRVNKRMGPLSVDNADLLDHYTKLRATLIASATKVPVVAPVLAGAAVGGGCEREPIFRVHQFERASDARERSY